MIAVSGISNLSMTAVPSFETLATRSSLGVGESVTGWACRVLHVELLFVASVNPARHKGS